MGLQGEAADVWRDPCAYWPGGAVTRDTGHRKPTLGAAGPACSRATQRHTEHASAYDRKRAGVGDGSACACAIVGLCAIEGQRRGQRASAKIARCPSLSFDQALHTSLFLSPDELEYDPGPHKPQVATLEAPGSAGKHTIRACPDTLGGRDDGCLTRWVLEAVHKHRLGACIMQRLVAPVLLSPTDFRSQP